MPKEKQSMFGVLFLSAGTALVLMAILAVAVIVIDLSRMAGA